MHATNVEKEPLRLDATAIAGLAALIVFLSVMVTLVTVYVAKQIVISSNMGSRPPADQSYAALNHVRGHVEDYWYEHRQMPQYMPLSQIGVDPTFVSDMPALQFVRLGGHPVDKQSTYIEAKIRPTIEHPSAGHSVFMTVDSMPEPTLRGRQTYYRCHVRGPNGQLPVVDMKNFPGICRHTDPLGGMGVEGESGPRRLEWPILK